MDLVLVLIALVGHILLWIMFINRLHGISLAERHIDLFTIVGFAGLMLIPIAVAIQLSLIGFLPFGHGQWQIVPLAVKAYFTICWIVTALGIFDWIFRRSKGPPFVVRRKKSTTIELPKSRVSENDEHKHHFLVHMPGNQTLQLDVVERTIHIDRLDHNLDGLTIAHLSDFHFTGNVGKIYFKDVVEACNQLEPDIIAITGDIVDTKDCIDWIPEILGNLKSRCGSYFVLGNHDRKIGTQGVQDALRDAGLISLSGLWTQITINDRPVVLAGNERPWGPAPVNMQDTPIDSECHDPLRILLSHSPDQFRWAIENDFDLMLAGHTHGGQIRIPLIGPIFSPCQTGTRYAVGVFHIYPTVLHVTQGISSQVPLRLNCSPEIGLLKLCSS